jgi:hypothetical protein
MDSKRLILMAFCTICLSSCDWLWPFGEELGYSLPYDCRLKNTTEETIVFSYHFDEYYKSITVPQKIDTLIDRSYFVDAGDDAFDWVWRSTDSVVIKLNGEVVRVWRNSEKDNPGKQFFNESFWIKQKGLYSEKSYTIWTFEITSEDIVSP